MPPWRRETNKAKKLSGADHSAGPARTIGPVNF
jgi:hypothetical protein